MQVSQIFLSSQSYKPSGLLEENINLIHKLFKDDNHVLYNNESLRSFILESYGEEVAWAFDELAPLAYKADLGRYCLLNTFGGWYFDLGVRVINPIQLPDNIEFFAFRDRNRYSYTAWACSIGIMYSKPNNKALQIAIEQIVQNCKNKYYGITPLCPTGPTLLGESLAKNGSQSNFAYGDFLDLTPGFNNTNTAFVLPDGTIMAWAKPAAGGDLTVLGGKGVNNYNDFWHKKEVYTSELNNPYKGLII